MSETCLKILLEIGASICTTSQVLGRRRTDKHTQHTHTHTHTQRTLVVVLPRKCPRNDTFFVSASRRTSGRSQPDVCVCVNLRGSDRMSAGPGHFHRTNGTFPRDKWDMSKGWLQSNVGVSRQTSLCLLFLSSRTRSAVWVSTAESVSGGHCGYFLFFLRFRHLEKAGSVRAGGRGGWLSLETIGKRGGYPRRRPGGGRHRCREDVCKEEGGGGQFVFFFRAEIPTKELL